MLPRPPGPPLFPYTTLFRSNKIEALTVKQTFVDSPAGDTRDVTKEPAKLEIPNLVITLAESHAKALYEWHDDFVIKGKDRKSTRLNSSHLVISYAVFCLKKK